MAAILAWIRRSYMIVLRGIGALIIAVIAYQILWGEIPYLNFNQWWIPPLLIGVVLLASRFFTGLVRGVLVGVGVLMLMVDINNVAMARLYPAELAGVRVAIEDGDTMVVAQADGARSQLSKAYYTRPDGTVDVKEYQRTRTPVSEDIAAARLARAEQIAISLGETLPHPRRELPGNSTEWMATNIPIHTRCVRIWAKGKVKRDPYTYAGPSGVDPDVAANPMFQRAHGDKITLLRGVPWGTFSGMVCDDASAQKNCGPAFPIGASRYLWYKHFGAGYLWVINNSFVPKQTADGLLSGIPIADLRDNRVNNGGFTFDQETAPAEMCSAQ